MQTTSTLGVLPDLIGFNLRRAYYKATLCFSNTLNDINITPLQFALLEVVSANEGLSQKAAAELVGTAPSILVKPMRDLEERGMIQRARSEEDRRNHVLKMTKAGKALQAISQSRIREVESQLTVNLSQSERVTLLNLLTKVVS